MVKKKKGVHKRSPLIMVKKKKSKVIKKKTKKSSIKLKINKNDRERVPTGIPNFDGLIQGGFEKNSTNLIVGNSGSGKSIFSMQFLIEGIKKGENCLYITFEEKKKVFFVNMKEFGWDLKKLEQTGKFTFLEYTPEKVRTMLEEGGGAIESVVLRKKIKRIIIDSITSFELLFEKDLKKREASLTLFSMLRKWDCTSLLTYEGDPFIDRKASSHTLEFESDSIILLYFQRAKNQRERYIEVLKMRGTRHSRKIYPFSVEKQGIIIGKKAISGKIGN